MGTTACNMHTGLEYDESSSNILNIYHPFCQLSFDKEQQEIPSCTLYILVYYFHVSY